MRFSRSMLRRVQLVGSWSMLVFLLFIVNVNYGHAQVSTDEMRRRIEAIEGMHPEGRLTAIETRLSNLEGVAKGVLGVLVAQLMLNALNLRARKDDRR